MAEYTKNYKLEKPNKEEKYSLATWNSNMTKIDNAIKDVEDSVTNTSNQTLNTHKTQQVLDHPDNSVTTEKIKDGAVTTNKLADSEVTPDTYTSVTVNQKGIVTGGTKVQVKDELITLDNTVSKLDTDTINNMISTLANITKLITGNNTVSENPVLNLKQLMDAYQLSQRGLLKRNTSYQVGDVVVHPNLPSYLRLECVQAGTTSNEVPSEITSAQGGGIHN